EQALEERLTVMLGVVLLGQPAIDAQQLERRDPEPLGLEAAQDLPDEPPLHAVRLEDDEGPLHVISPRTGPSCRPSRRRDAPRPFLASSVGNLTRSLVASWCSINAKRLDEPPRQLLVGVSAQSPDTNLGSVIQQRDDNPRQVAVVIRLEINVAGHRDRPGVGMIDGQDLGLSLPKSDDCLDHLLGVRLITRGALQAVPKRME